MRTHYSTHARQPCRSAGAQLPRNAGPAAWPSASFARSSATGVTASPSTGPSSTAITCGNGWGGGSWNTNGWRMPAWLSLRTPISGGHGGPQFQVGMGRILFFGVKGIYKLGTSSDKYGHGEMGVGWSHVRNTVVFAARLVGGNAHGSVNAAGTNRAATPTTVKPYSLKACKACRDERELQDIRAFRAAAAEMVAREDRRVVSDPRLARFYMWAQTETTVYVACRLPTGGRHLCVCLCARACMRSCMYALACVCECSRMCGGL
jgi:hypothetical protein